MLAARDYDLFSEAVAITDVGGRVVLWNQAAEELYGWTAAEVAGRPLADVAPGLCAADAERAVEGAAVSAHHRVVRCRDGTTVLAAVTEGPDRDAAGVRIGVIRVSHLAGGDRQRAAGPAAEPRSLAFEGPRDAAVGDHERVTAVANLAARMVHELNSPLAAALASVDVGLERLAAAPADPGPLRAALDDTRAAIVRIRELAHSTSLLARSETSPRTRVELDAVVDRGIAAAAATLRGRARLVRERAGAGHVDANAAQLAEVVVSLLVNATQALPAASPERNEIRVATLRDGAHAVIEVHDNGCGIPDALRGRIFEPFFTTKGVGGGMGLGLALANGIVRSYGGTLGVHSVLDAGSCFRIELPASPGQPGHREPERGPREPERGRGEPEARGARVPGGRPRVLVVDDEPMITTILLRFLARDHDVIAVNHGRDALAALAAPGPGFDLILCDVMMPGLTGQAVYEAAVAADPGLARRFVFITGGAFTPGDRRFLDGTAAPVIGKPFDLATLRAVVTAQLDRLAADGEPARLVGGAGLDPPGRGQPDHPGHAPGVPAAPRALSPERMVAHSIALTTLNGVLGASLDDADAMRDIAGALVPAFADLCSIVLVDEIDDELKVAARVAAGGLAQEVQGLPPTGMPAYIATLWRTILRTGRAQLIPDVDAYFRANAPPGDSYTAQLARLGGTAALFAPLVSRGRPLGLLASGMLARSGRAFVEADLAFAEEVGHRIGLAIDNARLHTRLRRGEARLQLALQTAPVRVFSQDLELRYTQIQGRGSGAPVAALLGRTDREAFPGAEGELLTELKRGVLGSGIGARAVVRLTDGGEPRDLDVALEPVRDDAGRVVGLTGAAWDITEQRQQVALREAAEARTRRLLDDAPEAYFLADARGRYIDVNAAACALVGYSRAELLTMGAADLVLPDDLPRLAEVRRALTPGAASIHAWRLRRKTGELVDVELNAKLLPDGTRQGFARDLTEHNRAERDRAHRARLDDHHRAQLAVLRESALVLAVLQELTPGDVRSVLRRVVDQARMLTGADYAAVGIGTDPDQPFEPWVWSGLSAEAAAAIGALPRARGALGWVARRGEALRVSRLQDHEASGGVPASHPPMEAFLGVPIVLDGRSVGNLYLARRPGGGGFTDEDEAIVSLLAGHAAIAIARAA